MSMVLVKISFSACQPAEKLGDDDSFFYSRDGGFAYKKNDGAGNVTADYFPVVHAHIQLLIADYVRHRHLHPTLDSDNGLDVLFWDGGFNQAKANDLMRSLKISGDEKLDDGYLTEGMARLIKLQRGLPPAIQENHVAERHTVREYSALATEGAKNDGDFVWTVYKMWVFLHFKPPHRARAQCI